MDTTTSTGPVLDVCGTCAVLIADDTAGDDPHRVALTDRLAVLGAMRPVIDCQACDELDTHPNLPGPCDVCGVVPEGGELHMIVTDPAPATA